MRSGQLIASNDDLILEIIKDPNYIIHSNCEIFTCITLTGKVSTKGVWRKAGWKKTRYGYAVLSYRHKRLATHRIIYAKYGSTPLEKDLVVNHIDSNPLNNDINNLELVTQAQNNKHAFDNGRKAVIGNKKIDFNIAEEIRALKQQGLSLNELVRRFSLSKSTLSYIVNNKIWNNKV